MFFKTEAITHRFWMWGLGNWLYNTSDASYETSVETKLISARTRVLVKVKFRRGLHTVFVILSHGYFTHMYMKFVMRKTCEKHRRSMLKVFCFSHCVFACFWPVLEASACAELEPWRWFYFFRIVFFLTMRHRSNKKTPDEREEETSPFYFKFPIFFSREVNWLAHLYSIGRPSFPLRHRNISNHWAVYCAIENSAFLRR